MIASLVQNTSMTIEDISKLRIPQMEDLFDGFEKNNKEQQKMLVGANSNRLEGIDAINALIHGNI